MKTEEMYDFAKAGTRKKFSVGITAGVTLGLALTAVLAVLLIAQYFYGIVTINGIDPAEAQKIGNWEIIDENYYATSYDQTTIDSQNIETAEVRDKKSGNKFMLFKTVFTEKEFLRAKDARLNKILSNYNLQNFYIKTTDKIEKYGEEINFSTVGWGQGRGAKGGIIANIDCLSKSGNINTVFIIGMNTPEKYDNERALYFINTFKCDADDKGVSQEEERNIDKLDSDKDGLTDKVEKMLKTDPYKADTDGDSFSDFDEVKNGFNPMVLRPYDKYSAEEFEKVKKDIKYVNEDVYRNLFGNN